MATATLDGCNAFGLSAMTPRASASTSLGVSPKCRSSPPASPSSCYYTRLGLRGRKEEPLLSTHPEPSASPAQTGRSSTSIVDDLISAARGKARPVYRGQADGAWLLQSGAIRRLCATYGVDLLDDIEELTYLHNEYHSDRLLGPLSRMAVSSSEGLPTTDIQRLTMLQHLGAATGLLDFTEDPLVALWFACRERLEADGKVFLIDISNPSFRDLNRGTKHDDSSSLFAPGHYCASFWHPELDSISSLRVIAQRSVFLLGTPLIPAGTWNEVVIPNHAKSDITAYLEQLGKSHSALFRDVYGHAASNGASEVISPRLRPRTAAADEKRAGDVAFIDGRYEDAISHYTAYLHGYRNVAEPYLLRANAYAARQLYGEALEDYDEGLKRMGNPTPDSRHVIFAQTMHSPAAHYNKANVLAALGRHELAVDEYEAAKGFPADRVFGNADIAYNQGNSYFELGRFREAARAYEAAGAGTANNAALIGRGNCLFAMGRLKEAQQMYRDASERGDALASGNLECLRAIQREVGDAEVDATFSDRILTISRHARRREDARVLFRSLLLMPPGNTGNRGIMGPGGKGYPGKGAISVILSG